jgi:class 3 adenylate cyclase
MSAARAGRVLERLLDRRNEHPERIPRIDREIQARFGQRQAVLVLDMCGFSRLTMRYGIIHFLAMIRRMRVIVQPLVERAGGRVVKTEADNLFAAFPAVPRALHAAQRITAEVDRRNAVLPADWDLHVGMGIGYGDLLVIGRGDFFGGELNLASKLGEDVAGPHEVLVTEAAAAAAGKRWRSRLRPRRARVGGVTVTFHQLVAGAGDGRRAQRRA